jgi:hypothetical protein
MSEAEQAAPVSEPAKRNPLIRIVGVVAALIIVIAGLLQTTRGLGDLFGWSDSAKAQRLIDDSNAAFNAAKVHAEAANPKFQALLTATDAQPLEEVRREHAAAGREAEQHYAQAGEQFRLAAKTLEEAVTLDMEDQFRTYLADKSRSYELLAKVCDDNQEIIRLVLDDALAYAELEPQVLEIAARRDAAQLEATEIGEKADAAMQEE